MDNHLTFDDHIFKIRRTAASRIKTQKYVLRGLPHSGALPVLGCVHLMSLRKLFRIMVRNQTESSALGCGKTLQQENTQTWIQHLQWSRCPDAKLDLSRGFWNLKDKHSIYDLRGPVAIASGIPRTIIGKRFFCFRATQIPEKLLLTNVEHHESHILPAFQHLFSF